MIRIVGCGFSCTGLVRLPVSVILRETHTGISGFGIFFPFFTRWSGLWTYPYFSGINLTGMRYTNRCLFLKMLIVTWSLQQTVVGQKGCDGYCHILLSSSNGLVTLSPTIPGVRRYSSWSFVWFAKRGRRIKCRLRDRSPLCQRVIPKM